MRHGKIWYQRKLSLNPKGMDGRQHQKHYSGLGNRDSVGTLPHYKRQLRQDFVDLGFYDQEIAHDKRVTAVRKQTTRMIKRIINDNRRI